MTSSPAKTGNKVESPIAAKPSTPGAGDKKSFPSKNNAVRSNSGRFTPKSSAQASQHSSNASPIKPLMADPVAYSPRGGATNVSGQSSNFRKNTTHNRSTENNRRDNNRELNSNESSFTSSRSGQQRGFFEDPVGSQSRGGYYDADDYGNQYRGSDRGYDQDYDLYTDFSNSSRSVQGNKLILLFVFIQSFILFAPTDFGGWCYELTSVRTSVRPSVSLCFV